MTTWLNIIIIITSHCRNYWVVVVVIFVVSSSYEYVCRSFKRRHYSIVSGYLPNVDGHFHSQCIIILLLKYWARVCYSSESVMVSIYLKFLVRKFGRFKSIFCMIGDDHHQCTVVESLSWFRCHKLCWVNGILGQQVQRGSIDV